MWRPREWKETRKEEWKQDVEEWSPPHHVGHSWRVVHYLQDNNNVYHKIISYARQSSHEQRSCTWKHQLWLHFTLCGSCQHFLALSGHTETQDVVLVSEGLSHPREKGTSSPEEPLWLALWLAVLLFDKQCQGLGKTLAQKLSQTLP